mmetsp:Transcript_39801/g.104128  ORF Transcript_39801/g.104128 Transcript_39801/m.104128 type:complete len:245 (+) Transcript_39801:1948-2682(+)
MVAVAASGRVSDAAPTRTPFPRTMDPGPHTMMPDLLSSKGKGARIPLQQYKVLGTITRPWSASRVGSSSRSMGTSFMRQKEAYASSSSLSIKHRRSTNQADTAWALSCVDMTTLLASPPDAKANSRQATEVCLPNFASAIHDRASDLTFTFFATSCSFCSPSCSSHKSIVSRLSSGCTMGTPEGSRPSKLIAPTPRPPGATQRIIRCVPARYSLPGMSWVKMRRRFVGSDSIVSSPCSSSQELL